MFLYMLLKCLYCLMWRCQKFVHDKLLAAAKKYPVGVVNGKLGSRKYKEIKKKYRASK